MSKTVLKKKQSKTIEKTDRKWSENCSKVTSKKHQQWSKNDAQKDEFLDTFFSKNSVFRLFLCTFLKGTFSEKLEKKGEREINKSVRKRWSKSTPFGTQGVAKERQKVTKKSKK